MVVEVTGCRSSTVVRIQYTFKIVLEEEVDALVKVLLGAGHPVGDAVVFHAMLHMVYGAHFALPIAGSSLMKEKMCALAVLTCSKIARFTLCCS